MFIPLSGRRLFTELDWEDFEGTVRGSTSPLCSCNNIKPCHVTSDLCYTFLNKVWHAAVWR